MAKDQSNPPAKLITLEIARAAGQAHGETAFTAMVSPEIFEESLRVAVAEWRSAGFSVPCLDKAEAAARAVYRGRALVAELVKRAEGSLSRIPAPWWNV